MKSFINEQLLPFVNRSLSERISAYRSRYSMNHVLIRLIEIQMTHKLKIYSNEIDTTKSVKLLGMEIDNS